MYRMVFILSLPRGHYPMVALIVLFSVLLLFYAIVQSFRTFAFILYV